MFAKQLRGGKTFVGRKCLPNPKRLANHGIKPQSKIESLFTIDLTTHLDPTKCHNLESASCGEDPNFQRWNVWSPSKKSYLSASMIEEGA